MAPGVFDFDDEAVPVAPAPAQDEATPEEPEEVGDGGISDADRLVRLWLEDTRIVKVRLSPVWFHRITGRDTLESHFRQAMMLSTLHLPALPDDPDDEDGEGFVDSTDPDALPADVQRVFNQLPSLGPRTLAAFEQVIADLDARYAAFADAEAYLIENALVIPLSLPVPPYIATRLNLWEGQYAPTGFSSNRLKGIHILDHYVSMDEYNANRDAR